MENSYEQFIDPPITESELVPAEALNHEPRKDILDLTLEQERLLGEESAEELMHIRKISYEKPDIDPSILFPLREAVNRALLLLKNPNVADLKARQKKDRPTVRYNKKAKVCKFPVAKPAKQMQNPNRQAAKPAKRKLPPYLEIIK